ncbi:hypothetical protein CYMTET_54877 [Cymbomonas tetramitiformis]|uniref:Uncharacterized protein n=1 Tax=Cymbomonas tetramitiformis TaxID=36881 RepID=A0AAE0EQA2_9CHLO|nr:hypothetical protein CYMTET_54877 [Cymbomonas tetramitiformis]
MPSSTPINSPSFIESPTQSKWNVRLESDSKGYLPNSEYMNKAPLTKCVQEDPRGNFEQGQRFAELKKPGCEASMRGPDPYHVSEDNQWVHHDRNIEFKQYARFENGVEKPCRRKDQDPYRVNDKNMWAKSDDRLKFSKERFPGIEPNTRGR